jgi:Bacterial dnaA protein helix-turn-helix
MSITLREFTSADEMRNFYRDLIARRNALGPPPVTRPPAPPAPELEPEQLADPGLEPEPPPPPAPPRPSLPSCSNSIRRIIIAAAQEFDAPPEVVCGAGRSKKDVVVRHAAVLLARDLTSLSISAIGRALNRDHATVLHAIRSMRRRLSEDHVLALKVARVRDRLLDPNFAGSHQ